MNNIYLRSVETLRAALHREGLDVDRATLEADLGQPLREAGIGQLHTIGCVLWRVYTVLCEAEGRLPHPALKPPGLPVVVVPDDVSSLTGPVT